MTMLFRQTTAAHVRSLSVFLECTNPMDRGTWINEGLKLSQRCRYGIGFVFRKKQEARKNLSQEAWMHDYFHQKAGRADDAL